MPAAPLLMTVRRPGSRNRARPRGGVGRREQSTPMLRTASSIARAAGSQRVCAKDQPASASIAMHDADAQSADLGDEMHRQRGQRTPRPRALPAAQIEQDLVRAAHDVLSDRGGIGAASPRRHRSRARFRSPRCHGWRDGAPRAARSRRTIAVGVEPVEVAVEDDHRSLRAGGRSTQSSAGSCRRARRRRRAAGRIPAGDRTPRRIAIVGRAPRPPRRRSAASGR